MRIGDQVEPRMLSVTPESHAATEFAGLTSNPNAAPHSTTARCSSVDRRQEEPGRDAVHVVRNIYTWLGTLGCTKRAAHCLPRVKRPPRSCWVPGRSEATSLAMGDTGTTGDHLDV